MRRPLDSAVIRRDDRLDRTRRLSTWIAGGATAASIGLAGVLGTAIPGRAMSSGNHPTAGQAGGSRGQGSGGGRGQGSGQAQPTGSHARAHGHQHRLSAPSTTPSPSTAPPVVSSGGS